MAEGKVTALLEAAYKRIEKPENWTQGHYARASVRGAVAPIESATCWCAEGALIAECGDIHSIGSLGWVAFSILSDLSREASAESLHRYNDTRTHGDVLVLFTDAIAAARRHGL